MGFVKNQVVEAGICKELHIRLARKQQLQLVDIGQKNSWLPTLRPHLVPRTNFLRWIDGLARAEISHFFKLALVIRPRGTLRQSAASNIRFLARSLSHIHAKGDSRARQKSAQSQKLVFRKGVHRVDQDRHDTWCGSGIPQLEAAADYGIQKALRLSRARARRNQRGFPRFNRTDCLFLVLVDVLDRRGHALAQKRMKQAIVDELLDGTALRKRTAESEIGAFEKWSRAGLRQRQQIAHLLVQA